ncbi:DNA polymerase III subunit gamma/tau [Marinomonas sp. 15G1-11]|uniref:DNA polymerase III subunit gamma/tau n=1 Tax=Marinomonas phaeophyticola TaxID=3004091 RepID=A0ABT4JW33_9GAMM|nr:DNA polymerase III subunit gamma/tau [Marinomonas sp. 15G1-11]MCZ2722282.1 DNA polymerase III subunit gamma/tau [Marinomonas sp. 15G1-11]
MSYQVLARKWRPQTFIEMAGQDHVLQALVNALRQQRLHHAYLFTGTRGVGKTTIARIFAKCLNCETNGISPEPCGTCSSCTEITEGRFVDLIEVDAASRTKVEDTRELLENVQYAPTRGRFKVYLIDEIHMLSTHSFNALLKTLEEPPAHVKFLLATTDPQKLPVTVLSRCLQFNLKNMSSARVVSYLTKILGEEKLSFEEAALWQIGQAANGSMRDALSLTDQAIAFGDGIISETGVTSMLGLVNQSQVLTLLEQIASNDALAVLNKVNELADYQPDFVSICASLMDALHRIAIEQQVPNVLEDQMGDLARIKTLGQRIAPQEVQLLYQSLLIGRRDLHLAHSPKSGFEMLMLRLIAFRPAPPVTIEMSSEPLVPVSVPTATAQKPSYHEENTELDKDNTAEVQSQSVPQEMPRPLVSSEVQIASKSRPLESQSADVLHDSAQVNKRQVGKGCQSSQENVKIDNVVTSANVSAERPPWEDPVVEAALSELDDTSINANGLNASLGRDGLNPDPDKTLLVGVLSAVDNIIDGRNSLDSTTARESGNETIQQVESEVLVPSQESQPQGIQHEVEDEPENESDEEEQAINESLDPHFSISDMVAALSDNESNSEHSETNKPEVQLSQAQKQVIDTVAQPALGMPLPSIVHYSELTMQTWWLVAPRLELTGLVQNILMNSSLIEATHAGLKIQVPLEYGHMLNQVRYEQIKQALGDFFDIDVPLIIETVEDVSGVTAEEFAASKRAEALQAAINHLNTHPVVKGLGERLGGQLIYESVKVKA